MCGHDEPARPTGAALPDWQPPLAPSRTPLIGRYGRLEPLHTGDHASSLFLTFEENQTGIDWTYLPYGPFDSLAAFKSWIDGTCLSQDPLFFAIVDADADRALGVASLMNVRPESGCIEVGHVHFGPALQRTRLGTEAVYLMMSHVFELGYRRFEWKCDSCNRRSRNAALRYGFSFEGIFRQHLVVKGRNRDTAWYAAVDREWPALRAAYETWLHPGNFDEHGLQRLRFGDLTKPILVQAG